MKALYKSEAAPGLELIDVPEPEIGPEDVKIRVLRTGICGTDLHIERWDDWAASAVDGSAHPGPRVLRRGRRGRRAGARRRRSATRCPARATSSAAPAATAAPDAGRCASAPRASGVQRNGAFAEYLTLPATNVWVHHSAIEPDVGALFDPLGNAVHTALAFPVVGEDVLVAGCGPIGLMAIAVARHVGARFIVGTDISARPARARRRGWAPTTPSNVRTETIRHAQHALAHARRLRRRVRDERRARRRCRR